MKQHMCAYCGQSGEFREKGRCLGCGAGALESKQASVTSYERGEPFAYNGCIVYAFRRIAECICEFQFWAGDRLLEKILISDSLLRDIEDRLEPGTSFMPLIWQMFEVAHGDRDKGLILDNSRREPAIIYFTRVMAPPLSLTWEQLVEEYKRDPQSVIKYNRGV